MLTPDKIPSKEPMLRVGIVLPEDKEQLIRINLDNTTMISSDGEEFEVQTSKLEIGVENNKLQWSADKKKFLCNELIIDSKFPGAVFEIERLRTGRAFHWEKRIDIKLNHQLILKSVENNIILINRLPLETYLACVATSEMSASCPDAFIEAQTIVARSWMLANVEQKHVHLGFDVCNDDCCQRFQGMNQLTEKSASASEKTRGMVLMYRGRICDARYSKSCGGTTEKYENLWKGEPVPYLTSKTDGPETSAIDLTKEENLKAWVNEQPNRYCSPHFIAEEHLSNYLGKVDENARYYRWEKVVKQAELLKNINAKLKIKAKSIRDLIPVRRADSGRMLELKIDYIDQNDQPGSISVFRDYNARNVLHPNFLYSSACTIEKLDHGPSGPDFKYRGAGWGHGAGLCQIGALGMALNGKHTKKILNHYYPGSTLDQIYK